MKYFLCALNAVYLGIPSECTERIISATGIQSSAFETGDQDTFISLPLLFGCADLAAPHGIVLKSVNKERKTILLAPSLDIDIEISEENIHSVPKAFSELLRYCNGSCFINVEQEERLIFTLDVEKIIKDYVCSAGCKSR